MGLLLTLLLTAGHFDHAPAHTARADALIPTLASLVPATATAGGSGFTLTVTGSGFLDTATVLWNGSPRSTAILSPSQITAVIPAGDLLTELPVATADVSVDNNDGSGPSAPLPFVINGPAVAAVQATIVPPAGAGSLSVLPAGGAGGLNGTLINGGSASYATLTLASYNGNPTSVQAFAPGAAFYDVHASGTALNGNLSVTFQLPASSPFISTLFYFDTSSRSFLRVHGSMQASGSFVADPSARTITVIFDASSVPTLAGLNGTVIAAGTPQAASPAPQANADSFFTPVNTTLTVPAPGLLGNDMQSSGDPLSAVLVSAPANGGVMLNADGSFMYTPIAGFIGVDTFSYLAHDNFTGIDSVAAQVTIGVGVSPATSAAASSAAPPPTPSPTPTPVTVVLSVFTLTVNTSGCGSVSQGAGPHSFGDGILLSVTPCSGSTFVTWSGGPCAGTNQSP
ncbi:MAG TPA: Ig-like domain-containing protein, partial [Dehalococcoidia bacterium]